MKRVPFVNKRYSLTSPYGHLYNTDTSLIYYGQFVWSQKSQKSCIPYLYNTDTSVKRTLGSVPLVSVLKRFDCIPKGKDCISGRRLPTEYLRGGGGFNYLERKATRERGPLGWAVMGELTKTSGVNS